MFIKGSTFFSVIFLKRWGFGDLVLKKETLGPMGHSSHTRSRFCVVLDYMGFIGIVFQKVSYSKSVFNSKNLLKHN